MGAMLIVSLKWSDAMSDIAVIGWFVGCVAATLGLIRACEWLRPRGVPGGAAEKEARR